jgi:uncharacterized repeat protein (TIGR01451 family)
MVRRTQRLSAALLATLLIVSALVGATGSVAAQTRVSGSPDLTLVAPDNRLVAGTESVVEVFVVNTGRVTQDGPDEFEALVQTARSVTFEAESEGPITVATGEVPVGTVPEGVSGPVSLRLRVDDGADPGTYQIPVEFTYKYSASVFAEGESVETTTRTRTITRDLEVVVERRPAFDVETVNSSLAVGDSGTVSFDLENVGVVDAEDATVTITSTDPEITFGNGAPAAESFVGDWDAGDTKRVEFRAQVAPDAIVRNYSVDLLVTYRDEDGQIRNSSTLVAGVNPTRGATFELVDSDAAVAVGDAGTLTLELENVGDVTATDATVAVQSTDSELTFGAGAPAAEAYVGTWEPDETKSVSFRARLAEDALDRPYSLNVSVTFRNPGGTRKAESLVAGLDPGAGPAFRMNVTESNLRVGGVGSVSGTIENVGESEARDVVVRLDANSSTVTPTDLDVTVGTLAPGSSAEFEYTLALAEGTAPGTRRLPFVIEYGSQGDDARAVDRADVLATVSTGDPAITVEPQNATFEVDSTGRLVLEVTNTEDTPQTDVTVRLTAEEPLSSADSVAFIPLLDPGESRLVVFDLEVSDDAVPKTQAVGVNVSYRDDAGRQLVTGTQQLPVEVVEPETTFPILPTAVAILALAAVGYWWYRRR